MCSLGILLGVSVDVEEADLVLVLGGGNNTEELTDLLLLEVLLGEVLEVSLGEVDHGGDNDGVLVLGDGDLVSEVSSLSLDLDSLGKEGLEVSENDNVVLNWLLEVDGELAGWLLDLASLASLGGGSFLGGGSLGHCDKCISANKK